jgi:hypothetical protein
MRRILTRSVIQKQLDLGKCSLGWILCRWIKYYLINPECSRSLHLFYSCVWKIVCHTYCQTFLTWRFGMRTTSTEIIIIIIQSITAFLCSLGLTRKVVLLETSIKMCI